MILGVGLDVLEVARLERALARTPRLEARVFTVAEVTHCAGRVDRLQALAARFAAKEACLKALGTGWSEGLGFLLVEVRSDARGAPALPASFAYDPVRRQLIAGLPAQNRVVLFGYDEIFGDGFE